MHKYSFHSKDSGERVKRKTKAGIHATYPRSIGIGEAISGPNRPLLSLP
jgi:hypothetical protein